MMLGTSGRGCDVDLSHFVRPEMRRALAAAVLVLAVVVGTTTAASGAERRAVLGRDWQAPRHLVEVDPLTFRRVGHRRVRLGGFATFLSISPDRALLLAAGQEASTPPAVRVIDLHRFRVVRDIELAEDGGIDEVEWLDARHAAVVVRDADATTVFIVDPRNPESTRALRFRGMDVGYFRRAGDRLVALAAPMRRVGVARLLVFAPDATVKVSVLDRIAKGSRLRSGRLRHSAQPGLAVDGAGTRAFVVDADDTVAEVQLGSLSVHYHEARRVSAVQRSSKDDATGWQIQARVEGRLLVVSGYRSAKGRQYAPHGLRLIDTRSWTTTLVDRLAGPFDVVGDRVLVESGRGVTAYALDGRPRWRVNEGRLWSGGRSITRPYLYLSRTDETTAVVVLATGRIVRVLEEKRFQPLRDGDTW